MPSPLEIQSSNISLKVKKSLCDRQKTNLGEFFSWKGPQGCYWHNVCLSSHSIIKSISKNTAIALICSHLRFLENKLWTFQPTFSILMSILGCSFTIFNHFTKLQDTVSPLKLLYINFVQLCKYKI